MDDLGTVRAITFDLETFCAAAAGLVGDFSQCLRDRPSRVLAHVGLSLVMCREALLGEAPIRPRAHPILARFTGVGPPLPLAHLKASMVGKLVSITG